MGGKSGNASCLAPPVPPAFNVGVGRRPGRARRLRGAGENSRPQPGRALNIESRGRGGGDGGKQRERGNGGRAQRAFPDFSSQVWTAIGRRLPSDQEVPRPDPPGASCTPLRGEGGEAGGWKELRGSGEGGGYGGRNGGHSRRGGATWGLPPLPCVRYVLGTGRPPPRRTPRRPSQ